jgi:16S rRNA (cytosine967-C5)-methyltransferase
MQDWLIPLLHSEFQEHFVEEVEALNEEAPVDIRVNTLKCDERADLMLALDRDGFYGNPTPHSPLGIRLKKRLPIFTNQAFKDGWFEMQDEGSQLVAAIVDAKPGEKIKGGYSHGM